MTSEVVSQVVGNHDFAQPRGDQLARIKALKQGQKMQDLPVELWHPSFRKYVLETPYRGGGPNLRLIRLLENQPSLTVTGFIFNKFVHPTDDRYVTVREAARLQGLPDSMHFYGGVGSTRQQVGNAVPPLLAKAVIEAVAARHVSSGEGAISSLSLFAGAGGFDVAADQVNFVDNSLATDIWPDAIETLTNWVGGRYPVVQADIAEISSFEAFWRSHTGRFDKPRLIIGGPPCQSFSQAGKQRGEVDARGRLVFEFLRSVEEIKPEAFILENVANIRGIAKGELLKKMVRIGEDLGYSVDWRILEAPDFGVPQRRKRFFMVGSLTQDASSLWPDKTHGPGAGEDFTSVADAFRGLPDAVVRPAR